MRTLSFSPLVTRTPCPTPTPPSYNAPMSLTTSFPLPTVARHLSPHPPQERISPETIKNLHTLFLPARLALLVIACGGEPGPYRMGVEEGGVVLFSGLAGNPDIATAL